MTRLVAWLCAGLVAVTTLGCEDDEVMTGGGGPGGPTGAASPAASGSASAEAELPVVEFGESDFIESDDSRDPFRDYARVFAKRKNDDRSIQRKVKASQFALDELKLVGIITRSVRMVMLEDPTGFAWAVSPGEYVGRAEMVSSGAADGEEVAINWRVDRIRPTDVVFIREDTAHPEIPPTTRVIPLYPDESERPGG